MYSTLWYCKMYVPIHYPYRIWYIINIPNPNNTVYNTNIVRNNIVFERISNKMKDYHCIILSLAFIVRYTNINDNFIGLLIGGRLKHAKQ